MVSLFMRVFGFVMGVFLLGFAAFLALMGWSFRKSKTSYFGGPATFWDWLVNIVAVVMFAVIGYGCVVGAFR